MGVAPGSTRDSEVEQHVAETDPHLQYQKESEKGAASGYASLDGSGELLYAQRPAATLTLPGSFPGFSTPVTVPATSVYRVVFGTVEVTASGTSDAKVAVQIEDAVGAGTYTTAVEIASPTGAAGIYSIPFSITVPTGRRYQLVAGGGAGVTETVATYSYMDV